MVSNMALTDYLDSLTHAAQWCDVRGISYSAGPGMVLGYVSGDLERICKGSVLISKERYKQLNQAEWKLCALEAGGVDNWSGYQDSLEDAKEDS